MARFMTGAECADITETLARFFDLRRDFTCDSLLIQRPIDSAGLLAKIDVGEYDPRWTERTMPKPERTYTLAAGELMCRFLTARSPLNERRPRASTALRALGSVAAKLPVDIFEATGFMLDGTLLTAPQLQIGCVVDPRGCDKVTEFLENQPHARDGQRMPFIITEYQNHRNEPITIGLNFWPAV